MFNFVNYWMVYHSVLFLALCECSRCFTPLASSVLSIFLSLVDLSVVLICVSLITSDIEHLFMFIVSSLWRYLLCILSVCKIICPFKKNLIFWTQSLWQVFYKYFLCGLYFIFLTVFLEVEFLILLFYFNFDEIYFINISFIVCAYFS